MNAQGNAALSVLSYGGSTIAFESINGKMMVNATQMAKPFGQTPAQWLRTQQASDLLKAVSVVRKCTTADLQHVKRGGRNQGTWFHEDVALLFAQWLSPKFYIACNDKLKELLTKQALTLPSRHGISAVLIENQVCFPYTDAVRSMGGSTRSSASKRKMRHPSQFRKAFGRNFITGEYFDMLKSYYDYRNSSTQLKLQFEGGADASA